MNPVNINLAKPKPARQADYAVITLMIAVLLAATVVNGWHYVNTQNEIQQYDAAWVRQHQSRQAAKRRNRKTRGQTLSETEINLLKEKSAQVNRIILEDIFPWSGLLDLLETAMPESMVVSHLATSDDLSQLTLNGYVASTRELSLFLKKLNEADIFKNSILSAISVAAGDLKPAGNHRTQTDIGYEIVIALHTAKMFAFQTSLSGK